jgi:hypothetical protein
MSLSCSMSSTSPRNHSRSPAVSSFLVTAAGDSDFLPTSVQPSMKSASSLDVSRTVLPVPSPHGSAKRPRSSFLQIRRTAVRPHADRPRQRDHRSRRKSSAAPSTPSPSMRHPSGAHQRQTRARRLIHDLHRTNAVVVVLAPEKRRTVSRGSPKNMPIVGQPCPLRRSSVAASAIFCFRPRPDPRGNRSARRVPLAAAALSARARAARNFWISVAYGPLPPEQRAGSPGCRRRGQDGLRRGDTVEERAARRYVAEKPLRHVGQGARDEGLPGAGGARDDHVLVLVHPATCGELPHDRLVELAAGRVVDLLDARLAAA